MKKPDAAWLKRYKSELTGEFREPQAGEMYVPVYDSGEVAKRGTPQRGPVMGKWQEIANGMRWILEAAAEVKLPHDDREEAARVANKLILFDGSSNPYDYNGRRLRWFVEEVKANSIKRSVATLAIYMVFDAFVCDQHDARNTDAYESAALGCAGGHAIMTMLESLHASMKQ